MFEKLFIFVLLFLRGWIIVTSYNFDVKDGTIVFDDPKIFDGSRSSYFGFSTALMRIGTNEDAFVLVGAPRANVTKIRSVNEPGSVYKCSVKRGGDCVEWNLDDTGNGGFIVDRIFRVNQIKDNAWIGASVEVERDTVVVCAPRWRNNIISGNSANWFMNGMCYRTSVQSELNFDYPADKRLIPLLGDNRQITLSDNVRIYNYGMGQTGFSLHLYSNDDEKCDILIGNPGVHNWKGVPLLKKSGFYDPVVPSIGRENAILSADYFGYSVSSGFYMKKGERLYAAGAPRGADMFGRVLIFQFSIIAEKMLIVKKILNGEQHGEYFGSSLASCDVDNDGIDEIVVGAPLWSKYMDEGRVYVYHVGIDGRFVTRYLEGEFVGARFGSVLTCLGDLDHDGYGDVAVGAPHENDNGAIYIYNGSPIGLAAKYSQRIIGQTVSPNIRGFGGSISKPLDTNGNGYPDIAVGAYLSDQVVVLRSQPVASLRVTIGYKGDKQLLQRNTTFFTIDVCSFYDGFHVPAKIHVRKILTIDPVHGRAFFGNRKSVNGEYKLSDSLHSGRKICDELLINVERDVENVIEPMEIGVSLALDTLPARDSEKSIDEFCAKCPIINEALSKLNDTIKLPYAVDCGDDNVCTSNLKVNVSASNLGSNGNRYTLGSKKTIKLAMKVVNIGEPAYNAQLHVLVPSPIFIGGITPECTEDNDNRPDKFVRVNCQLGNPLKKEITTYLELDMSEVRIEKSDNVVIYVDVTTRSFDIDGTKKMNNFTIYFDVDADIGIAGKSQQDIYSYLNRDEPRSLDGITFQHVYQVQKFGTSPIEKSILTITVPTHRKNDDGTISEIANVNKTLGIIDGQKFSCTITSKIPDPTIIATDYPIDGPPENRTFYFNCTNPDVVECTTIICELGSFENSLIVAKLVVTIDLRLKNLSPEIKEARDIIYFVTSGSVGITKPTSIVDKSDVTFVATTFVGSPIASRVALWIIVSSIFLGIFFLVLLTIGLIRFGFFRRNKREELDALKAQNHNNDGVVLETSSSMQALNED